MSDRDEAVLERPALFASLPFHGLATLFESATLFGLLLRIPLLGFVLTILVLVGTGLLLLMLLQLPFFFLFGAFGKLAAFRASGEDVVA